MKSTFTLGNVDDYKVFLSSAISNKESFTTISSGLSRKILFPSGAKARYFGGNTKSNIVEGAFLVQMVEKDIDRYIEKHGIPNYIEYRDVQQFNTKKISELLQTKKNKPILSIDINACYWNIAYKLGYISESLYKRGLNTCKKEGLLVSIGCLNKKIHIKTYSNGVLMSKGHDEERERRYSPFYWNVIAESYKIMMESFELFGDDWYMFLTDCLFVEYSKMKEAIKWIKEKGFNYKTNNVQFKSLTGNELVWMDHKANKDKRIHTLNRDIQSSYAVYKISKGAY